MDVKANLLVDTIALVIALVVLCSETAWQQRAADYQKRFRSLLVAVCLVLAADLMAWLCDGGLFPGARMLCFLANTGFYIMQIVYCWRWALFAWDWARGFQPMARREQWLLAVPLLTELALLALNCFTGNVFLIDGGNHYHRGAGYLINLAPYGAYIAVALFALCRAWLTACDGGQKRHSVTLIVGMLLPATGSLIQSRNYGLSFTWPLGTLSLLLIYLNMQQEQNALDKAEAASVKAELAESRMSIMLSQIQPHFLYNSLTVISELCETEPATARYATLQFSAFLRGNMNSLTMNKPIAFDHELQHTENYLALELLRFPNRLHTVFDVETTEFLIPTLTLQPIVENAVRYGVTKRPEGGTVTIRARETPESYLVTVSDDGVGYDPVAPKADGRTHIGITNVRDRLQRMVNGTLDITSVPGAGTVAVITIPKAGGEPPTAS